jgi:hypothetical protein
VPRSRRGCRRCQRRVRNRHTIRRSAAGESASPVLRVPSPSAAAVSTIMRS